MSEDSGTRRVLVVDDEPDIVTYFTILLESNGFDVLSSDNAHEAVSIAAEQRPGLICLDIMMPRKSGLACYKELRQKEETKTIPVIIVSAFGQPKEFKGDRFKMIINEDDIPEPEGFIEKPIQPDEFISAIEENYKAEPEGE